MAFALCVWGNGLEGGLGDGVNDVANIPKCVLRTYLPFSCISVGSNHTLAVLKDGRLFAWGDNTHGVCYGTVNSNDVKGSLGLAGLLILRSLSRGC